MEKVDSLLKNPDLLREYSNNSRKMAIIDANERIYHVIKKVLN